MRWDRLLLIPISITHESQHMTDEILWDIEMKDTFQIKSFAFNWIVEKFHGVMLNKYKKIQKERKGKVFYNKSNILPLSKIMFDKQITLETVESKLVYIIFSVFILCHKANFRRNKFI